MKISIYDEFDEYVGSFVSTNHSLATKTMIKQVSIYIDEVKRMEIAKKIEIASLHNQRENLRYYFKHKKTTQLQVAIEDLTNSIKEINESRFVSQLLLIEARAKQKYLRAFDSMIDNSEFLFERRTRRPPRNEINALISFGNTFMYRRIATEIYKTVLDIRVGFVHAANSRSESLNLDIAEIFKPIIVDRAIFTLIHRGQILKRDHFVYGEAGRVLLNQKGKKIFIHEMENKLYQKITIKGCPLTYDKLIRNEIQKVFKFVMMGEKYVPFKYT